MKVAWGCDWIARGARLWPSTEALLDVSRWLSYTYADLNQRAHAVAVSLREHAIQLGDRVARLAASSVDYLDLFFACSKLGATFVPLNWRLSAAEITTQIEQTKLQNVVVGDALQQLWQATSTQQQPLLTTVRQLDNIACKKLALQASVNLDAEDIVCLPTSGCAPTKADLTGFHKEHLASIKVPKHFELCTSLPMTSAGASAATSPCGVDRHNSGSFDPGGPP